jgi:hypothetical protein
MVVTLAFDDNAGRWRIAVDTRLGNYVDPDPENSFLPPVTRASRERREA